LIHRPTLCIFVGDTPESDIRRANEFSRRDENTWYSILVRTGVFWEGSTQRFPPRAIIDNVLEAVKRGIRREYRNAVKKVAMNASAAVAVTEE
jgi:ribonucleotide monophosphatase NagD (HAD superfamily)